MTNEKSMVDGYRQQISLRPIAEQHTIYAAARCLRSTIEHAGALGDIAISLVLLERAQQSEDKHNSQGE